MEKFNSFSKQKILRILIFLRDQAEIKYSKFCYFFQISKKNCALNRLKKITFAPYKNKNLMNEE